MSFSYRPLLLIASLALLPATGALAQSASSATGEASHPGTTYQAPAGSTARTSPTTPGATGHTVVPGSNSTVAGDHRGTAVGKTGTLPAQSGEGAAGGGGSAGSGGAK